MTKRKYVRVEIVKESIAKIHIHRAEAKNALNEQLVGELEQVIRQLEKEAHIVCVIIVGNKNTFIAGADIKEMASASVTDAYQYASKMKALHNLITFSKKPYVAAISGYCLGGGLELALACDMRIADETSKLGLPEITLGIIPGAGGIHRLAEIVGISFATQMVMTGEVLDATTAKEWKIVNSISSNVEKSALSIAKSIQSKSSYAITAVKKLLNERHGKQSELILENEIHNFASLFAYPDAFEGMSAFIEKRQPIFQKGG